MATATLNPLNATPETTRVIVSTYVCMSVTLIVLATRAWKSTTWRRRLGLDDIALSLALVAGILESALTEYSVKRGLGTYIRPGSPGKLQSVSELVYTSDLFFLISMFFAKMAVLRLVYRIASAAALNKGKLMVLQISVALWVVFSLPAIAFQCGMPHPWLYVPERCTQSGSLWFPTLGLNVLTDAWLAVCVWTALPEMSLQPRQRQVILGLFSTRLLTCLLCVVQIAVLAPALKSADQPRALPTPTVLKQLVMNASILSAAIPVLYRPLGTYSAVVSNPSAELFTSDKTTTQLADIQSPAPTATPERITQKETAVTVGAPTLGHEDFSTRFSVAFHKEISESSKV